MPDPSATARAVFLSYAREDTDAARRITDALRAFGVEVWFDQSELRGGDEWDRKIRQQIRECALFVPVISGRTQERAEGYFRREWKLAVERTHDMAAGLAFIVPVVVDDTTEAEALAPEEFLRVQWTRLANGVPTPEFVQQVKRLLESPRKPVLRSEHAKPPTLPEHLKEAVRARQAAEAAAAAPAKRRGGWTIGAVTAVVVGIATAVYVSQRPSAAAPAAATPAAAPAPASEARQLVAKAKALLEGYAQDDTLRDNLILAEQLGKRAVELDPADAEAWAVHGRVQLTLENFGWVNDQRNEGRGHIARALQLNPNLPEVRLAQADNLRRQGKASLPEAEKILRALVQQVPDDRRVLRMLAMVLNSQERPDEALVYYDRAAALPGGDAKALQSRCQILYVQGRYAEAEAAINQSLALLPTNAARVQKMKLAMVRDDLPAAQALLDSVPAAALTDDRSAYEAARLCLWLGQPDRALQLLRAASNDFFTDSQVYGMPRGLMTGRAHALAGRAEAARSEWLAALALVERRLAASPNDVGLLFSRARLRGLTGTKAEARDDLKLAQQLMAGASEPNLAARLAFVRASVLRDIGDDEASLAALEIMVREWVTAKNQFSVPQNLTVLLRRDPAWALLRDHPRMQAVIQALEAKK